MYTQAAITFLSESNHIFDKEDIQISSMDGDEKIKKVKRAYFFFLIYSVGVIPKCFLNVSEK
jgi:hypothetical protein